MNLLILVKRFNIDSSKHWLTEELIYNLEKKGNSIDVLHMDLLGDDAFSIKKISKNITLFKIGVRAGFKPLQIIKALRLFKKTIKENHYDIVINFSIASVFFGMTRFCKNNKIANKSALIIWDFFPIHQIEIGRLKKGALSKALYFFERNEVYEADYVFLMSKANVAFFKDYFPNYHGSINILPVWANNRSHIPKKGIKKDDSTLKIVFGGQLERGRGIEQILQAAESFDKSVQFILIGKKSNYATKVLDKTKLQNIKVLPPVSRDKYLDLLSSVDIGLIITVPNVTIPSFPSKVLDYMVASLPIIACVEDSGDFGGFIEDKAKCGFKVSAGDTESLICLIKKMKEMKHENIELGINGHNYFLKNMTTDVVTDNFIKIIS